MCIAYPAIVILFLRSGKSSGIFMNKSSFVSTPESFIRLRSASKSWSYSKRHLNFALYKVQTLGVIESRWGAKEYTMALLSAWNTPRLFFGRQKNCPGSPGPGRSSVPSTASIKMHLIPVIFLINRHFSEISLEITFWFFHFSSILNQWL